MEQAPNITGRKLPVVSDALIQVYMQQQQDVGGDISRPHDQQHMVYESDDDHAQMEKMWTFSSRCEYSQTGLWRGLSGCGEWDLIGRKLS